MNTTPRLALVASAALALTACGSSPSLPAAPENQPPATVVQGRVQTWSGTGTASLLTADGQRLARADVAADGTFRLTLPEAAAVAGLTRTAAEVLSQGGSGCTGTVTSSDAAARGYAFATLNVQDAAGARQVLAADIERTGPLSAALLARTWLYADRDTRLGGELNCGGLLGIASAPVSVDVRVKAGWNVVGIVLSASAGLGGVSAGGSMSATTDVPTTWVTSAELTSELPGR